MSPNERQTPRFISCVFLYEVINSCFMLTMATAATSHQSTGLDCLSLRRTSPSCQSSNGSGYGCLLVVADSCPVPSKLMIRDSVRFLNANWTHVSFYFNRQLFDPEKECLLEGFRVKISSSSSTDCPCKTFTLDEFRKPVTMATEKFHCLQANMDGFQVRKRPILSFSITTLPVHKGKEADQTVTATSVKLFSACMLCQMTTSCPICSKCRIPQFKNVSVTKFTDSSVNMSWTPPQTSCPFTTIIEVWRVLADKKIIKEKPLKFLQQNKTSVVLTNIERHVLLIYKVYGLQDIRGIKKEGHFHPTCTFVIDEPVDCKWTDNWDNWSSCINASVQVRTRKQQAEQYGGHPCNYSSILWREERPCRDWPGGADNEKDCDSSSKECTSDVQWIMPAAVIPICVVVFLVLVACKNRYPSGSTWQTVTMKKPTVYSLSSPTTQSVNFSLDPPTGQGQKIYVSYSRHSNEHKDEVYRFLTFLRENGYEAISDHWHSNEICKPGWLDKIMDSTSFDSFIVVCSRQLRQVWVGQAEEEPCGDDALTVHEARFVQCRPNLRVLCVLLESSFHEASCIPPTLDDKPVIRYPGGETSLLWQLSGEEKYPFPLEMWDDSISSRSKEIQADIMSVYTDSQPYCESSL